MKKKIVIFGASGFLGQHILKVFHEDNNLEIVAVKRESKVLQKSNLSTKIKIVGFESTELRHELADADVVINLCGANIASKPWTVERKKELWDSRVKTTEKIKDKITNIISNLPLEEKKSKTLRELVFISASAVGYYTDFEQKNKFITETDVKNENSQKGKGFLSDLAAAWEKSAIFTEEEKEQLLLSKINVRSIQLRIGLVLGKEGGALAPILVATKFFMGTIIGSGKQSVSWVAAKEIPFIIKYIVEKQSITGPVNVVAPQNISFSYFMKEIGKYLKRPVWFKVPGFILKILMKERADLILNGDAVYPSVLINAGYTFKHPNLPAALKEL